ncbi:MAG: hypothetical protein RDV48_26830 [Candidatus Eremiobacteraeota bacterium]|nr:hypothetical protein [Candidatus Eremiobacteraeota bacterium]
MHSCRAHRFIFFAAVMLLVISGSAFSQARRATDSLILPGSPSGEVKDGVLMRPKGATILEVLSTSPLVNRIRIEQTDLSVPAIGTNPNRVFYDGDPLRMTNRRLDMAGVNKVRFTVWVRGERRIAEAVRLEWEAGR